jgi:hypothetical protein
VNCTHLLSHVRCRQGNAVTEAVSALRAKSGGWFALPRDPTCRRFAGHQAVELRLALSFCNALMVSFKTLLFASREFAGRHTVVDAFLLFAWVDVRLVFELRAQRSNAESGQRRWGGKRTGIGGTGSCECSELVESENPPRHCSLQHLSATREPARCVQPYVSHPETRGVCRERVGRVRGGTCTGSTDTNPYHRYA